MDNSMASRKATILSLRISSSIVIRTGLPRKCLHGSKRGKRRYDELLLFSDVADVSHRVLQDFVIADLNINIDEAAAAVTDVHLCFCTWKVHGRHLNRSLVRAGGSQMFASEQARQTTLR
jgi:hypothetical protein